MGLGSMFFSASYMNDPSALGGNKLQTNWLQFYLPGELEAAREAAGVERGIIYLGFDITQGGQGADPDYIGLFAVEIVNNRGFALGYHTARCKVEDQAQRAEDFADQYRPTLIVLEETASRGFAYVSLTTQINKGRGSKYPVVVRKPQGARDKGGKEMRLIAMGARFETGQVRLPGIINNAGEVVVDPRWDAFVQQWRSFPAGHDDLLDACYWSIYEAFSEVVAAGTTRPPQQIETSAEALETLFAKNTHIRNQLLAATGGYMPPIKDILVHIRRNDLREWIVELQKRSAQPKDGRGRVLRPIGANRDRQPIRWRQ